MRAAQQGVEEENHVVQVHGVNPCPCPCLHPAVFASLPLVPSVKTLSVMVAMLPVNLTMQVVLEDGVEVGGVVVAAMVAEVVDQNGVLSWQAQPDQVPEQQTHQAQPQQVPQQQSRHSTMDATSINDSRPATTTLATASSANHSTAVAAAFMVAPYLSGTTANNRGSFSLRGNSILRGNDAFDYDT